MFFNRNKKERTPREKADRAQKGMIARLAGCAYLIYVVYQLLKSTFDKEGTPDSKWVIVIAIVLLILAVVVITITIIDFIRCWKQGIFRASTYEEVDIEDYVKSGEIEEPSADVVAPGELTAYDDEDDEDLDEDLDDDAGEPEPDDGAPAGQPPEDDAAHSEEPEKKNDTAD